MRVRGVILAAGMARRMGELKQLLPFRGKPLLQHVIDAARASCLSHVLLVLGHGQERIRPQLDVAGVEVVANQSFAAGQSTSVQLGANHGPEADGVMFLLGDQPLLLPATIDALCACFLAQRPGAVVPIHQGTMGNPVVLGPFFLDQLATLSGDVGPRQLLRQHPQHLYFLDVADPGILWDVDTQADYTRLCAMDQPGFATISHQEKAS